MEGFTYTEMADAFGPMTADRGVVQAVEHAARAEARWASGEERAAAMAAGRAIERLNADDRYWHGRILVASRVTAENVAAMGGVIDDRPEDFFALERGLVEGSVLSPEGKALVAREVSEADDLDRAADLDPEAERSELVDLEADLKTGRPRFGRLRRVASVVAGSAVVAFDATGFAGAAVAGGMTGAVAASTFGPLGVVVVGATAAGGVLQVKDPALASVRKGVAMVRRPAPPEDPA
jgi:hypothetical protein